MPSLTYEDLGGISGVVTNPKVPGSIRGRDRNHRQRFAFECDPARPFTGIIHLQGCVGAPEKTEEHTVWFDIAEMIINNEGGTWSFEPLGEFSSVRVVCRPGNYWTAAQSAVAAVTTATGAFTINGITITVPSGAGVAALATIINETAAIILAGNIVADTVDTTILRIYVTDGLPLILLDTTNTPLADLGFTLGTHRPGVISRISMLR